MPPVADRRPHIAVVGSGIAGLRAADALLKREVDARIVVFGDEPHRTYNRPGLTKKRYPLSDALESTIAEDVRVKGAENDAVTWRLGTGVRSADLSGRTLRLSTGETFEYDALVIAAGVRPRTAFGDGGECALHTHRTLRGLGDARYVHQRLQASEKVTITGAGFVACELASLAKEYGCEVLMLEALRRGPFESLLGERLATALGRRLVQHGITFLTGDSARELLCAAEPSHAEPPPDRSLSDQSLSDRSLFIEAIGSVPNVEWLDGNGLDLSDGVRVDAYMRVSPWDNVFAAGDVARYPDPWTAGSLTRREFWKNAIDTGDLAGRSLASSLGYGSVTSPIGYFPSMSTEVLGLRIQIAGDPRASDAMEVVCGDPDEPEQGVLVAYLREGTAVGAAYLDKGARYNSAYIKLLRSLRER
ncbi:pyridine nucleotide-disulfide oxidoreductase [Streptomyces capoamus]|uniref:Pyridine nucleotide-disulfide oxidoreductase n=1 Tax=Streptomyces capoamus TaxID=68183 RepID=A0A919EWJ8_9ACTN|nr:pyridine nucleotide-disulfide oxidoreductase [Streptomyces libani subsp. rufus]GHG51618.1 pyridine nucleotide-disulfide oxidoreductase [Streptomyces capoamus]